MVFFGNRVTHAPHQTNCNFKAKAEELKLYGNFQYKTIKAHHRGTQRQYSSKPLKHTIVKRILVFKR